ncbi:O-antigen ligase family protein [Bacillus coreaensis]
MSFRAIIFGFVCLLFIFTPFQKGLYFDSNLYMIELFIFLFFILVVSYQLIRQKQVLLQFPLLIVVLPLCWVVSYFFAETPLGVINQILRWTAYSALFYVMSYVALSEKYRTYLLYLVHLTGIILAFHAILGYMGLIEAEDIILADRLAGVFQYPNTLAVLLGALFLFSIIKILDPLLSRKERVFYGAPIVLYVLLLLFTESRAVIALLPVSWLISLLVLKIADQVRMTILTILAGAWGLIGYQFFAQHHLLLLGTIIVASVALIWVSEYSLKLDIKVEKGVGRIKGIHFILPIVGLGSIVLLALDLFYKGFVSRLLPAAIQDRLYNQPDTFMERMIIAKDVIRASMDAPIFGFGGNAWGVLYPSYQSLPYQAREIHNGFLEWLINTGWLGLLSFFIVFTYLFIQVFKQIKIEMNYTAISALIFILMIFIHSVIDFNLSFGTIWLFIFTIMAVALPVEKVSIGSRSKGILITGMSMLVVLVLFSSVYSYRFLQSNQVYENALEEQSTSVIKTEVYKSLQYNPYDVEKWNALGILLEDSSTIDKQIELEPNNPKVYQNAANLFEEIGNVKKSLVMVEKGLELDAMNNDLRTKEIQLNTNLALSEGKSYAEMAIKRYKKYQSDVEKINVALPSQRYNSREFAVSEEAIYYTALSYFHLEQWEDINLIIPDPTKVKNQQVKIRLLVLSEIASDKMDIPSPYIQWIRKHESEEEYISYYKQILGL